MMWKILAPILIGIVIIAAIMMMKGNKNQNQIQEGNPSSFPQPARPPFSAPTWSSRGEWSIPFAVRYAVSFSDGKNEGPLSHWSDYYRSSQFSNPILSRFPVALQQGITHINLYRQFEGHQPILLDTLPYPYLTRYTDRSGDDF